MNLSDIARRNLSVLIIVIITVVASIPLLSSYMVVGHDGYFHLYRIMGVADGLAHGEFPVRMQYVQAFGYGYPASLCYGDLFLYIPAALVALGFSVTRAYALFAILVNVATAVLSYICFKGIFKTRSIALVGCALWTLAPYRLVNMYVRTAVGEYLAMAFLPMIALGAYLVFTRSQESACRKGWIWAGVGIACVIYAHVLSTAFVLVLCIVAVIIGLIFRHDRRTVLDVVKTVACALLLSCAFWVPFLDFSMSNDLLMSPYSVVDNISRVDNRALQPMQLLMFLPTMAGQVATTSAGVAPDMPSHIGWAILGGALVWVAVVAIGAVDKGDRFRMTVAIALAASALLLMFLTTNIIPWGSLPIAGPFRWLTDFCISVQFQNRLLGPISILLVLLACMGLQDLRRRDVRVANIAASVLVAFALIEAGASVTSVLVDAPDIAFSFSEEDEYPAVSRGGVAMGEYLPEEASIESIPAPASYGDVEAWSIDEEGRDLIVDVETGDGGGSVSLDRFFYTQYEAIPNEGFTGSAALSSMAGAVRLDLAPGSTGSVTVRFVVPVIWNVALWVSWLSWAALIAYGIVGHLRHRQGSRAPRAVES